MRILATVVAAAIVLAIAIARRPADFTIQRSIWIAAGADIVFSLIDDLREWERWSPYDKQDPSVRKTFTGRSGVGASFHYASRKLGEGRMTIVDRVANEQLALRAEFIKPFAAVNRLEFTLRAERNGTSVTWSMAGQNNFLFKALGVFVNVDRMVGRDFEIGLAYLKRHSEVKSAQQLTTARSA